MTFTRVQTDLNRHFTNRLEQFLDDCMSTCDHAGIAEKSAAIMLVAMLVSEAANAVVAMGGPEEDFIAACRLAHQKSPHHLGRSKKRARKA